ncbi:hypothetical protein [Bifidobacterium animalis]|uniref:hypothetical protein n=1 Tax=Bifidobacterium animalis TaxID=28025 RepID=UPI003974F922
MRTSRRHCASSDRGVDGFRIDVAHGLAKDLDSKPSPRWTRTACSTPTIAMGTTRCGPRRSARHLP